MRLSNTMKKILIIDDEEELITLLTEILEYENYVVDSANSGLEALKKLNSETYSLIVTDVMMPDMDGIALIEKVLSKYRSIKIIVMSGWFDESELEHLHAKDDRLIRAIITKPFSPTELLKLVAREIGS